MSLYHELLAHSLYDKGYHVSIILPSKAKAFIQSINQRAKTDKIDAQNLCRMGLERKLDKWKPADPIYVELRSLTRERESLLKEKTIILNKIHAIEKAYYNSENSKKRLSSRLELIQSQISETEKEIVDVINSQEMIKDKVSNIT